MASLKYTDSNFEKCKERIERIELIRLALAHIEARKAGVEISEVDLIPKPPKRTGNFA
jgi:hypothetical protein